MRDLAAASAYLAVALSGAVPAWVSALFATALLLSLVQRRPLAAHRGWSVIVLLLVAAVLFGLAFRGLLDLVLAAVCFAALVTAHRLVSEPEPATSQQVLLASLLLIAGGAALSGEVWFGACLLGFGVFSCLHLGLASIEGPGERDEDLPVAPVFRQVSVGVAVALVGGLAFFILFPRLSWNVASRRSSPGLLGATTGMSDRVRLGGGGDLKTSARTVLRAALDPDPGATSLDRYWVGRHFDAFDGREWTGSGRPQPADMVVHLGWSTSPPLWQKIELLPAYGARTLVGLSDPVVFGPAQALTAGGAVPAALVNLPGEEVRFGTAAAAYTYTVSSVDARSVRLPDLERQQGLQLPELDPRVAALARQLTQGAADDSERARRLERWLRGNLAYSLELEGEVADPVAAFLFERKSGHCEHFATALAVMLRTLGIPARVTVGFFGGQRVGDRYLVRAGDAHAWVEAWLSGDRWTTLDATPDSGRRGQPTPILAVLGAALERLEEAWRSSVMDYSFIDQASFVRNLVRPPRAAAEGEATGPAAQWRLPSGRRLGAGLAVAATLALGAWLLTRPRQRVHPATTFLLQLEERLRRASLARGEAEDLEALGRRLAVTRHPLQGPVGRAIRRYLEARFGGRPLGKGEAEVLLRAVAPPRQGV
jgi:transglutaminase-like putative cysteine protease